MSDKAFLSLSASTVLTEDARPRFNGLRGSIGLAVVEGQLCVSIAEEGSTRVMIARLHETVLDDFCGMIADHVAEISPAAAAALQKEQEQWPTMQ